MNRRPERSEVSVTGQPTGQPTLIQQHSNKPPTHKSWLNFKVFAQSPQDSGRVEARGVLESVVVVFSVWFCEVLWGVVGGGVGGRQKGGGRGERGWMFSRSHLRRHHRNRVMGVV